MNGSINIKAIILRLISKWYYFVFSAIVIGPLAYVYLKYSPKIYQVEATLLMEDERQNNLGGKEFLKGMELFAAKTALEDEIGIIKSYTMVGKAIRELDFGISYYVTRSFRTVEKYEDVPFIVLLDSTYDQIINTRIQVTPIGGKRL
jgi:tyrosine-protein kinase Etk/Wzc